METKTTEVQEYLKNPNENTPNLKDYTTIKTYDDACAALGEKVDEVVLTNAGVPKHIIALMKLELVCKALWGGEVKVYPYPNGNRCYYYPWFSFCSKYAVEHMDSKKSDLLLFDDADCSAYGGWGVIGTDGQFSGADMHGGFRLCLDTREKATYFGIQFLELWAQYLAYNFKVKEHLK